MRHLRVCFIVIIAGLGWAASADAVTEDPYSHFERYVRPVLARHCFSCHGPQQQESGLRLDSRAAILRGGDRGASVNLARPAESLLIAAIRREGSLQMPPDEEIPAEEVSALLDWIKQGLPWPPAAETPESPQPAQRTHWAFQPVRRPLPPTTADETWAQTPLDRFILARLAAHGLRPQPPADRSTFIRRATFDLTGLPPSLAAIRTFLQDERPAARRRLVDRLLASPEYGHRWGRHWLDVARYADNKGYVFFEQPKFPWAYTYRDYVVRALNEDLPFDRFVMQQLAADQLDLGDDRRPLTALGFLTLGGHFMNNTHDMIDDRIDVVTRGLMGLTVTCARCHDHKFDPIPQADYYSLYGVFRSSYEPVLPPLFETPAATAEYQEFAAEMARRENGLLDFVTEKHRSLVADARTRIADYLLAAHARRGQPPADDFMLLVEQGDLNPSMILRWQVYLDDPSLDADVWSPWRELAELSAASFTRRAAERLAQLFQSPESATLNPMVRRALAAAQLTSMQDVAQRYEAVLRAIDQQWQQTLAAANGTAEPPPTSLAQPAAEQLRQVLYGPTAPPQTPLAMDWGFLSLFPDRPTQAEYKKLLKAVEEWSVKGAAAPARAMVLFDSPVPHQPRVFRRGNPNRLGETVPRRFLGAVAPQHEPLDRGSGRLQLAQAIVRRENPLTARVLVNRVWMYHFGQGLVTTPSDFGVRSDPPSHPELLDFLAAEFMDSGWSIKQLHRLIMTSAAYQQASRSPPGSPQPQSDPRLLDPENRLLWKMNRRRLEFEALRDSLLAVAGRLDSAMYGPAGNPFVDQSNDSRRSIYGFVDRMNVSSLLTTFDFPNPATSSPQRTSTTVPPQALYLMNNSFVRTIAEQLIQRPDLANVTDSARVHRIYLLLFGRAPAAEELAWATDFLAEYPEATGWAMMTQALLMTNEFAFVD